MIIIIEYYRIYCFLWSRNSFFYDGIILLKKLNSLLEFFSQFGDNYYN